MSTSGFVQEKEKREGWNRPPHIEPDGEGELLELAMGPHHPSTHGVFRMDVALDGERVIRLKPVFGYLPVDDVPERGDVFGPAVLVFQVVRVFPHIQPDDRERAIHDGRILVGQRDDFDLRSLLDEPGPSRSKPRGGSGCK